jgi:hypothetical protein
MGSLEECDHDLDPFLAHERGEDGPDDLYDGDW